MKRIVLGAVLFAGLALTVVLMCAPPGRAQVPGGSEGDRIRKGLKIIPVPYNTAGKDINLIGLGSYIVNASGDCNGCHTTETGPFLPGGDPFMGEPEKIDPDKYLVGGTNFFANVTSRNLRPDAGGKPAGLSFDEFKTVLRTGFDFDHAHPQFGPLLQVMPWPNFGKMTDRDIAAIYEYLRSLPQHEGFEP